MNPRDAVTRAETAGSLLRSPEALRAAASRGPDAARDLEGTFELRSWIVAGIAAHQAGLPAELVDYQLCYRSVAGTGCAMAFVTWGDGQ